MKKTLWSPEEDAILKRYVEQHGSCRWKEVAAQTGIKRSAKSCRLRWVNYLRPGLKCNPLSLAEKKILLQLHKRFGNRWAKIMSYLPGRSDNDIKNFWHTFKRQQDRRSQMRLLREHHKYALHHITNIEPIIPTANNHNLLSCRIVERPDHLSSSKKEPIAQNYMSMDKLPLDNFTYSPLISANNYLSSKEPLPKINNNIYPEGLHLVLCKFMNPRAYIDLLE